MKQAGLVILLFMSCMVYGQNGGENTFDFLSIASSAKAVALGGQQVAGVADDINMSYFNPALLDSTQHGDISVSYADYLIDTSIGYCTYSLNKGDFGNFALGIHFIDYGSFRETDTDGNFTGAEFDASEYALNIIWSKPITNKITVGVNLKPVYSSFEEYRSLGISVDFGARYSLSDDRLNFGLAVKNIGTQLKTYVDNGQSEKLPFDVELGFSHKLKHAPLRYYINMHHLHDWDFVEKANRNSSFGKQLARHVNLGVELIFSKNFHLRGGYNPLRREQLGLDENMSTVGFSWGCMFWISKFKLEYSSARYHIGGSTNFFTLTTNLHQFF